MTEDSKRDVTRRHVERLEPNAQPEEERANWLAMQLVRHMDDERTRLGELEAETRTLSTQLRVTREERDAATTELGRLQIAHLRTRRELNTVRQQLDEARAEVESLPAAKPVTATEPVTFGMAAARDAWRRGCVAGDMQALLGPTGAWCGVHHEPSRASVFRLSPDYTPTPAVVSAIVKAEPGRLCAACVAQPGAPHGDTFAWINGGWRHWFYGEWAESFHGGHPEGYPRTWAIAIRRDYAERSESKWEVCDDPEPDSGERHRPRRARGDW